jgi:molybdopterin converting factor subunit 1
MNKVKLLFFATLKEKAGTNLSELEIPSGLTVLEFKEKLFSAFSALPKSRANIIVAINGEFAFDAEKIPQDAEIALFPPVSGG